MVCQKSLTIIVRSRCFLILFDDVALLKYFQHHIATGNNCPIEFSIPPLYSTILMMWDLEGCPVLVLNLRYRVILLNRMLFLSYKYIVHIIKSNIFRNMGYEISLYRNIS